MRKAGMGCLNMWWAFPLLEISQQDQELELMLKGTPLKLGERLGSVIFLLLFLFLVSKQQCEIYPRAFCSVQSFPCTTEQRTANTAKKAG